MIYTCSECVMRRELLFYGWILEWIWNSLNPRTLPLNGVKKNSECSMYHVVQLHIYVKTILAILIIQEMKQDFWPKCAWGANLHVSNHILVIVWCVLHTIECVDSLGINFSKVVFESRKRDICSRLDVCSKYKEVNGPIYPCENGFACSDIQSS